MDVMKTLSDIGIVPVIAIDDAKKAMPLANALVAGGLPCAEVTFRTEAGEEAIRNMVKGCPEMLVGAGTVLNVEKAKKAIEAGAKFIVSPGYNDELVKWCVDNKIPCMPGCANPSEMTKAYNMGLKVVKIFPAENLGGIDYIKACGAALPLKFMPTGGVNTKNLSLYATSDKIFACGGTWMVKKDMIENEEWDKITNICKEAVRVLLGFSLAHIGINTESKEESANLTNDIAKLFDVPFIEKSASHFAGSLVEVMNMKGRGRLGHIGVATNNMDRALYHMKRQGIEFDDTSIVIDEKTKRIRLIYIKGDFGGFEIHLVQK